MQAEKRNRFIYRAAYRLLGPVLRRAFSYDCEDVQPKSDTYMVISNHNLNWDPLLVGIAFREPMYYVASEHIFRWGFVSKLISWALDPIMRLKATSEAKTVQQMLRRLKDGHNVCVFAEGCCSFNGQTCDIAGAIGKLAKISGAGLVTFRLEGAYLKKPRWAKYYRKGGIKGYMVNEYTPEQLKSMSASAVNSAILSDLYYNAFEEQSKNGTSYPGKKLAEHAEWALYACPECGRLLTLKSSGDELSCSCGLKVKYDENGRFRSGSALYKYPDVLGWDTWQREHLRSIAANAGQAEITSCGGQSLKTYIRGQKESVVGTGKMTLFADRLVFDFGSSTRTFMFDELFDMTVHGRDILMFSTKEGENYEVTSEILRSALVFVEAYKAHAAGV